jgi:hypothetical protein
MRMGGQLHAPAALPPGKGPGTHCIGGWVGPRAGLDGCEKSRPHRDFRIVSCCAITDSSSFIGVRGRLQAGRQEEVGTWNTWKPRLTRSFFVSFVAIFIRNKVIIFLWSLQNIILFLGKSVWEFCNSRFTPFLSDVYVCLLYSRSSLLRGLCRCCGTENHFPFTITHSVCRGWVFGHGFASLCVVEGNRPMVSRFLPYLEIRAVVETSFFGFILQYNQIILTGWEQNFA